MRLHILGWQGPVPGKNGACSGYLLEATSGEALLVDLGNGALSRLVGLRRPETLSAIVLTHLHWDHISDMLPLGYLAGANTVPVYAQQEPAFAVQALTSVGWQLRAHQEDAVGPFRLHFLPARHPVPASCLRVECEGKAIVFTGDTNTLPGLAQFAAGADLLLADAGLCEADWAEEKSHLSPRLCASLAREAGARRLVLTHLAAKNDPVALLAEAQAVYPGAILASDGLVIEI